MIRCYGLDWSYDKGVTGRCGSGPRSDLHAMHGIYVLYDRKGGLAYVGRSSDGDNPGIAGRLYHHRVEKGWDFDTYSWFGTLPFGQDGTVERHAPPTSVIEAARSVEALMIYLLAPPWNGTSGAYKHIPLYRQVDA